MTDPRFSTPEGGAKAVEGLPDLTASALLLREQTMKMVDQFAQLACAGVDPRDIVLCEQREFCEKKIITRYWLELKDCRREAVPGEV